MLKLHTTMSIEKVNQAVAPLREQLLTHPLYESLQSREALKVFMEHHVFAVWDFMSLLKSLQRKLTCVDLPWKPATDRQTARLINEIVLAEETDLGEDGQPISHLEMYLEAMQQAGADSSRFLEFLAKIQQGKAWQEALQEANVPNSVRGFVHYSLKIAENAPLPAVAAAFTYGREELLPEVFTEVVKKLNQEEGKLSKLVFYLEHHIELDGDEHGPMAEKMVQAACGESAENWGLAEEAAVASLQKRLQLWEGIRVAAEKELTAY
jgi:hypothetical protein